MHDYKRQAIELLERLRIGTRFYETLIFKLMAIIRENRFTLSDLRTSEEEIVVLRVRGSKLEALAHVCLLTGESCSEPINIRKRPRPMTKQCSNHSGSGIFYCPKL
jgi:hypothetical protein